MKYSFTLLLTLIALIALGQSNSVDELNQIYMSGDKEKAIEMATELLKASHDNIQYKLVLGRALADMGKFKDAIPHLEFTATNAPGSNWRKAWALDYLGGCYFMTDRYYDAKKAIDACIQMNATQNATNDATRKSLLYGTNEYYNDWKIIESDHFRFHFQNMSETDRNKFVSSSETAFQTINAFFESDLPKKIDVIVWTSREDAMNLLRASLGFANPENCVVHTHYQQTRGHEITHVISYYSTEMISRNRFINEGTAVCFDLSNNDRIQQVKKWKTDNNRKISILDFWENSNNYPEEIVYPLAGIFVKAIIDTFGKEKYIEFIGNQTYEHAKSVFGEELDQLIQDFEKKVNS